MAKSPSLYGLELAEALSLNELIDELFQEFSSVYGNSFENFAEAAIAVKTFVKRNKNEIVERTAFTKIAGRDCNSMVGLQVMLLSRLGLDAKIAHPKQWTRWFHGFLTDELNAPLKGLSKKKPKNTVPMTVEAFVKRLKFTRPFVQQNMGLGNSKR